MAIGRKPKSDMPAPTGGTATATMEPPSAPNGSEECLAAGQALVERGEVDIEKRAKLRSAAEGDRTKFSESAPTRTGVARGALQEAGPKS
ncbi:MAG: hypothetical protein AB8G26_19070, partial [Ilumatobacter sp.]